jgi:hypothetical protein
LALVDANEIVLETRWEMREQFFAGKGFAHLLIVCGNVVFGVAIVAAVFDGDAVAAGEFGAIKTTKNFGGLTGKHWANDQFESADRW